MEVQPAANVVYTLKLDTHKNINTPKLNTRLEELLGYKIHKTNAKTKDNIGAYKKGMVFEILGTLNSFENNFNASEKGCNKPITPTLLGPFRSWAYPNTFRSKRVKNDIEISTIK